MRPLESQLQMSSHLTMYNRIKELLTREGYLPDDPSGEEMCEALVRWVAMVERARDSKRYWTH